MNLIKTLQVAKAFIGTPIRDGPLSFYQGGYFFIKKIVRKLSLAEKVVCFKVMKGKNCPQRQRKFFEIH